MKDFTHQMPENFRILREMWQGDGGIVPYTCKYGSVDTEDFDNSVCYVGRIGDKTLILHVERIDKVGDFCREREFD